MSDYTFADLINNTNLDLRGICTILHETIAELHPEFVEIIWEKQQIASYGVGPKKMSEHYVYIAPQKKHVNLGLYHGTELPDPHALLEGTGKRLRHVKIRDEALARDERIKDLIVAALAEIRESLA